MAIWMRIGRSANKAEIRACRYLERRLPDDYIFFSNVSITDLNGHTWDYDVILLGRHAVYVIELKNYGGVIQGDRYVWTVVTGDALFTSPNRNILDTVDEKARLLKAKIQQSAGILGRIYVHSCVCLTGHRGKIQIKDEPQRLERIRWLYGIESYLTSIQALPAPHTLAVNITDIRRDHARLQNIIENRAIFKPLEKQEQIGEYQVIDIAWRARRYLALYSSHSGKWPPQTLLKVYNIPDDAVSETVERTIRNINRELNALRMIREREIYNPQSGAENVIAAYETFLHPSGRHYVVVMEWVNGRLLADMLAQEGVLGLHEQIKIAAQICRGMACAHRAGVVHRNLTPHNIIVAFDGVVKIINFDFAKFVPEPHPQTVIEQTIAGITRFLDLNYMAPELQNQSYHQANQLSDIYSIGLILAEMFFGASPRLGRRTDDGQLASGNPQIGEWIKEMVDKMCQEAMAQRYNTLYRAAEKFDLLLDLANTEEGQ